MVAGDRIDASVDFSDTNIYIVIYGTGGGFNSVAFNGPHIYDYQDTISSFTSVSLKAATLTGFDASRISFDADNIYLNFAGLGIPGYDTVVSVDLNTSTVVPEPASLLLLGTGLVGAVRAVRRKRG
jgi:hypothetical protein